jgi:adenylate cyclase
LSGDARRLAAIMFTDMVGYTALTQSDESAALSLLQTQNGMILPLIRAHGGTPVKTIGDAHLAEFGSALEAVTCAVEIQRRVKQYDDSASTRESFKLRVGIHIGDVVHKDNDVFGDAVNIASRLEPLAEPGGVCISQQVYDQVHNKVEFRLEKLPFHQLKNVSSRIEAYKVIDVQTGPPAEQEMLKERVAILPLSNFSPSSQDEYLADGMTEELITAISGVEGLRVIARTSVMKFKNKETDIAEIGRALNAGTILEGSFRKIGERIRVTVQLIDARTEEHRWASNYDGDMKDIFSIQSDIAGKVAQALEKKLLDQSAAHRRAVNIEAYELYLKGRHYWNRRNADGVTQALKLFKAAVEKDPDFAKAYAGIADCYSIGRGLQLFKRDEADELARAAIQKALDLDDSIAEAHASRGLVLDNLGRYSEAEESFKRALSLNPTWASWKKPSRRPNSRLSLTRFRLLHGTSWG